MIIINNYNCNCNCHTIIILYDGCLLYSIQYIVYNIDIYI